MEQVCASLDRAQLARFTKNPTVQPRHRHDAILPSGMTPLHEAVLYGRINDVRGLLGAGADVTRTDREGTTAQTIARLHGNTEIVHCIVTEHDELVRVLGKCLGRAPTQMEIYAVASLEKIRRFRQNVRNHTHVVGPQLLRVARAGDLAGVKGLLDSGEIGVDVIDKKTDETAFSAALAGGKRAVYLHLMERGAKMRGVCHIGGKRHSILVAAVLTGEVNFVRQVVACGAPAAPLEDGATETCALVEAMRTGSIEMVETLVELGGRFKRSMEELDLLYPLKYELIRLRADEASLPWLLLCTACFFQDQKLFTYVIQKYPELQDLRDKPQYPATVLTFAVYRENEAMVTELLQRGAFIAPGTQHCVFFAAVLVKSARMLELLLQYNDRASAAHYNVIEESRTAECLLSVAAYLDAMECFKLLLPLETQRYYRHVALTWAIKRGNSAIAALLLDAMSPLSEQDLWMCIWTTDCPVVLDLVLSACARDSVPVSLIKQHFINCWRNRANLELLDVYIAHGIDILHDNEDGPPQTSRAMEDAVRGWIGRSIPSATTLRFMLANGVPIVSRGKSGTTPEQELLTLKSKEDDPLTKKLYDDCLETFAAFALR